MGGGCAKTMLTAVWWAVMMKNCLRTKMYTWLPILLEAPRMKELLDLGPRAPSVVRSAWMDTLRLCRMGVSLFLQNVATSSVASASVIPLRMLTLAQLVGKRSTINGTIPFIYEMFTTAQDRPMDRQPGWLFCMVSASSFLSSKRLSKINVWCKLVFCFPTPYILLLSPVWCYGARSRDPPRSAQHLCPSGWSEPRVGKKESGILQLSIMALASLWSLCVGQEVSLLGKFAPVLVGAEHSQGTCQLAILPAKQWPGQTVHLVQGYQYINCPWNSLAGGLSFPSHESRGDLWLCLKLIIDVQCFLQIKRLCRATCFLRMRKCNKACSSLALQQSGRCSTASILSPVLPVGAVPIPPHLYSPAVLRNPTHAPKFFAWHRAFKANRTSKYLSVFSFLLRCVLCCLQCPPTLSFSVPTA